MTQACDRDKLKLKAVILHDGNEEIRLSQIGSLLKIQSQVLELDGAHFNELWLA